MAKSDRQNSRNKTRRKGVKLGGGGSGAQGGSTGDGEEIRGAGASYTATLNERQNKSLNRNAGPSRPMANKGYIKGVSQGQRKTGKV